MKHLFYIIIFLFLYSCSDEGKTVYQSDFSGDGNYIGSFTLLTANGKSHTAIIDGEEILITLPKDTEFEGIKSQIELYENATIQPNPNDISNWTQEYRFLVTSYSGKSRIYTYRINLVESNNPQTVILATQEEVDAFGKSGQSYISGNLIIGTDGVYDNDGNGNSILREPMITNLKNLNKLEKIDGELIIRPNYTRENIEGFASLKSIGGFRIKDEELMLKSIYFPKLEKVTYNIDCYSICLQDLDFPVLETIGGNINLQTADLQLLKTPELKEIKGDLRLNGNLYKDPSGFPTVNPLSSFDFPKLERVRTIQIENYGMLSALSFPSITTSLNISIIYNTNLSDYSTFSPVIPSLGENHWKIYGNQYNPTYQDMIDGKYKK